MRGTCSKVLKAPVLLLVLAFAGCGIPGPAQKYQPPDQVKDFVKLYGMHCAGCHGADGRKGPAVPLNDPIFLAIISDDELEHITAEGRPGTLMPAFAQSNGGPLTREQIVALRDGMRERWKAESKKPGETLPEYSIEVARKSGAMPGNEERGTQIFASTCANCHGNSGQGGKQAGALNDPAFLALMSDQALRRIIITGRPDLKMPDYRDQHQGTETRPLSPQEIADLTALLASWRGSSSVTSR